MWPQYTRKYGKVNITIKQLVGFWTCIYARTATTGIRGHADKKKKTKKTKKYVKPRRQPDLQYAF